ncbi:MAG: DNA repair protein RadC [Anaerolineae bacterium]|nr:DNA repair protein RadC [Anaerolineae bacterium]
MQHDERPRERLWHLGPSVMSDAELIAILLRTGYKGVNVMQVSAHLLEECGRLAGLARVPIRELAAIKGIGQVKAIELYACFELGRRIAAANPEEKPRISSPADAARMLSDMGVLEQEEMRILLLNTKNQVLARPRAYQGSVHTTVVRISELFREAVRQNATGIILAHNHPSGDPTPSPEDAAITREIIKAGTLLDIEVLDHLVIGAHGKFVSLKERGLGF